ncbi:MAG: hypothetical protein ACRDL7_06190 [Gaiellaceae bacterium]
MELVAQEIQDLKEEIKELKRDVEPLSLRMPDIMAIVFSAEFLWAIIQYLS